MSNTPMVIMWLNNNAVILSQRKAPTEEMPTVDASPPRTATLAPSLSVVSNRYLPFGNMTNECLSPAFDYHTFTRIYDSREPAFFFGSDISNPLQVESRY